MSATLRKEYLYEYPFCFVCGRMWLGHGYWLETHHIVRRAVRGAECRNNYMVLCNDLSGGGCHSHYHAGGGVDERGNKLPDLTPGMLIAAKRRVDPDFDEAALLALFRPDATEWPERWQPVDVPESLRRFP